MPLRTFGHRMKSIKITGLGLALALSPFAAGISAADDLETHVLEMRDGVLAPDRIEITSGQPVRIVVRNTGTTPAEFESLRLRKEKVLAPGAESVVVIRGASPGEYPFFDDFHPDTGQGVIVAR